MQQQRHLENVTKHLTGNKSFFVCLFFFVFFLFFLMIHSHERETSYDPINYLKQDYFSFTHTKYNHRFSIGYLCYWVDFLSVMMSWMFNQIRGTMTAFSRKDVLQGFCKGFISCEWIKANNYIVQWYGLQWLTNFSTNPFTTSSTRQKLKIFSKYLSVHQYTISAKH